MPVVLKFANLPMSYHIEYFNRHVLRELESWPTDVLADYARLIELLLEHDPDLRMPYSKALGDGLFELRAKGRKGIGRASCRERVLTDV